MPPLPPPRPTGALRRAGLVALFAGSILAGAFAGIYLAYESDLPQVSSLENFQPNIITEVYAADGSPLGNFSIERRVIVGFSDIPPVLRNAVVAVEDADFWKHIGVNVWRVPSAAISNLRSGRKGQGFSTLTMQLSRVLFLTPEKTYDRKVKEIILAFQIEKNFTKEEIFTLYCNQVYFGNGNYGVAATSQFLFDKRIKDLTLAEAALVAGLPQNPSRLSPVDQPEQALQRRNHVLQRMQEEKYITAEEAQRAMAQPLALHLHKDPPSVAPYFLEEIRKYLEREYGSQRIYQGGLRVYTTLDPVMQQGATLALQQGLRRLDRKARGFVKPEETVLKDGAFPEVVHLDDWDRPIVPEAIVHGVVLSSDRSLAVVQVGDYRAALTARDIAWTRKTNVAEALPRGAIVPVVVKALKEEGDRRIAQVELEQEPKLEGALIAIEPADGRRQGHGRRLRLRAQQVQPRDPGVPPGGLVVQADHLRGGAGARRATRRRPSWWTPPSPSPTTTACGRRGTTTARSGGRSRCGAPSNRAGTSPPSRRCRRSASRPASSTRRSSGSPGPCSRTCRSRSAPARRRRRRWPRPSRTFANQGLRMKPMYVSRITDREGNIVEEARPAARDAIRADTAFIMTSPAEGRGRARHRRPGPRPQTADRRQDRHHQRLDGRLVRRLRAGAVLPRSGSASTTRP